MSQTANLRVVARGLDQLKKELSAVAPDLKNQLLATYRGYAKQVAQNAASRVQEQPPMRGWRTTAPVKPRNGRGGWIPWDPSRVKAGMIYKAGVRDTSGGKKYSFGYRVVNASPQGAIVEIAGKRSGGQQGKSNNPNAGAQFIRNLNVYGAPGRFIWKAYDQLKDDIITGTQRETNRIATEYEARINGLGGGN